MTKRWISYALIGAYGTFIVVSLIAGIEAGRRSGANFVDFAKEMALILPAAFILIGLFDVWVPREVVERHLGSGTGLRAHLWSIALAATTVGGLYVAFPVSHALYQKGARVAVVFAYLGLSAVCRVPMTLFEISFLGVEFALLRYAVSVPLVIATSELLGALLVRRGFEIRNPEQ
jgi:uncharacterized membrane protein YraQ (UPF0718 family)